MFIYDNKKKVLLIYLSIINILQVLLIYLSVINILQVFWQMDQHMLLFHFPPYPILVANNEE